MSQEKLASEWAVANVPPSAGSNPALIPMKVGDKVVKDTKHWKPNDFDLWGRGEGVGEIVEPPFELEPGEYDVRWPAGRCFETADQIKPWNKRSSTT